MIEEFDITMANTPSVFDLKKLNNEEYVSFLTKAGTPVHLVSSEKHLEFLPRVEYLYPFFQKNGIFWLIPCCTPKGVPYGYVLRGFSEKDYRSCVNPQSAQLMFGWEKFDSRFRYGVPLVLTEGVKDGLFIQTIYPYCLSFLSSDVSLDTLNYLCKITNRFILALDNDKSGDKHRQTLTTELSNRKCRVASMVPKEKDFGKYFNNLGFYERHFKQQLQYALLKLGSGNGVV